MGEKPQLIYQGSVKDILGPIDQNKVIFDYSDAFSIFDWGRMPDQLEGKGAALSMLAAHFFSELEDPKIWERVSSSKAALEMRKAAASLPIATVSSGKNVSKYSGQTYSISSKFNELGEQLKNEGLRTHFIGSLKEKTDITPVALDQLDQPAKRLLVKRVIAKPPVSHLVVGREVLDYQIVRNTLGSRLIPLEFIFRFSCPKGSSLIKRLKKNPDYRMSLAMPEGSAENLEGVNWGFPVMEISTKLETSDRYVSLTEALALSGIDAPLFEEVLMRTAWVACYLKDAFAQKGIVLQDGKLEWGLDENNSPFLVDAIGPDELRISYKGTQLSKEFLRTYYRDSDWHIATERAKSQAMEEGILDWKKLVQETPPALAEKEKNLARQLYFTLTNAMTGKNWFAEALTLDELVKRMAD